MNAENFFKQFKGNYLHNLHHPRLDHTVYILIYDVTPDAITRAEILEDDYRLGRARPLSTYQKYFKSGWKKHVKKAVSAKEYHTDVKNFTCNCGQQKYDRHHLCKHLCQAIAEPSIAFWTQIYRRRVVPIYRHPEIMQKGADGPPSKAIAFIEPDDGGSVTDGDDHVWSGDKTVLAGGGGWRELEARKSRLLGKRSRPFDEGEMTRPILDHDRSSSPAAAAVEYGEDDEAQVFFTS
jgi:hypothetical protein